MGGPDWECPWGSLEGAQLRVGGQCRGQRLLTPSSAQEVQGLTPSGACSKKADSSPPCMPTRQSG